MELRTKSKRPGMDCYTDVYFDQCEGFSEHINDPTAYKIVLVNDGSFVVDEQGQYRMITGPVAMILNEKSNLNIVTESKVKTRTIFFKPSVIRDEFTIESLNSGKYDKFLSAVKSDTYLTDDEKIKTAITGDVKFEDDFSNSMIYQDALYLLEFTRHNSEIIYYSITTPEYDALRRLMVSIRIELDDQPDNYWILRTRHFLTSILFMVTADFYRNERQDDIYKDLLVAKVARYCWEHLEENITLSDLLKKFSINKKTLNDAFNNEVSMTCMAYLEKMRINEAKLQLQFSDRTVSEISFLCGYDDTNYFTKVFKKLTGTTPTEYQKNMKK